MSTVNAWRVSSGNSGHCGVPAVFPRCGAENRSNWHVMGWRGMNISPTRFVRPMLRPLPKIAMGHQRPSAILPKYAGLRDRRAGPPGYANNHSLIGRTSVLGLQEVDQKKNQKGCSGKYASLWTAPHARERAAPTRDATDTKAREPRSRGCSVVVLYNEIHPQSALKMASPRQFIRAKSK